MRFCRCHQHQHPAEVNPPCSLTSQSRVRPSATSLSSYLQTKFQRQQNICILTPGERRFGCKGCCFHRITLECVCQGVTSHMVKALAASSCRGRNLMMQTFSWSIAGHLVRGKYWANTKSPIFYSYCQDREGGRHTQVRQKKVHIRSHGALLVKDWQDHQEAHQCPLWVLLINLTCVLP